MKMRSTKTYWAEVVEYFSIPPAQAALHFDFITGKYNLGRYHHNLDHVFTLLELIDRETLFHEERITLILVSFYHDLIYVPGSSSNERKSAHLLNEHFGNLTKYKAVILLAKKIIRETQKHKSNEPLSQLFLDMDMSILGSSIDTYATYKKQVRAEFKNVPDFIYQVGRGKFIRNLLKRESIFFTKNFIQLYEDKARCNLRNELNTMI